jgi:hypothetical protein
VLSDVKRLPASGTVALAYSVEGAGGAAPRIRYIKPAKSRGKKAAPRGKQRRTKRR